MISIDISMPYSKVIKSSVSQMRPRDTNDITRVIYGPSENEAGCVWGGITIWLFPLSITGVPPALAIKWWEEGHPRWRYEDR